MQNNRDRLIELISKVQYMGGLESKLADHPTENRTTKSTMFGNDCDK